MSTFSRTVKMGGPKDAEKTDASSAASDKKDEVEVALPPEPPAVVVTRVVNVTWERAGAKTMPAVPRPNFAPPIPRTDLPPLEGLDDELDPPTEPGNSRAPLSQRPSTAERVSLFDPPSSSGSIADTFEKLLGDVDARFASMIEDGTSPGVKGEGRSVVEGELADVRELFAQLAAKHMRQVRDFMIDLKWGEAPQSWIALSEPVVRSLRGAAERLELAELCAALDGFGAALEKASKSRERTVAGEMRDELLAAYEKLALVMPQAFALDMDRSQRESVIVLSLLLQIPDVRKVIIDKLYAAGLSSLDTLFAAKADDVAQTTGISHSLAERIVERFQFYRAELNATQPDATRAPERQRLGTLVKRMRHQHEEYERVSDGWSEDAATQKKNLRQARAATLLEVNVMLARLGEVERLHELEKLPFGRKVHALEGWLEEAERAYGQ